MTSTPEIGCQGCKTTLDFDISMAFNPTVDVNERTVFAYEALVRGPNGASAADILARVNDDNRYAFDQRCRVRAVEIAAALGMRENLSINFMPNAVYEPSRCLRTTLEAAHRTGFLIENIIFETIEDEHIHDASYVKDIFATYRREGFKKGVQHFRARLAWRTLRAHLP